MGSPNSELSLLLTNDDEIMELNQEFRGISTPTDVLSFSMLEDCDEEDDTLTIPKAPEIEELDQMLGDIVISVDTAIRQANDGEHAIRAGVAQDSWDLTKELIFLCIHGYLHIIGYDHINPEDEIKMLKQERQLFTEWGYFYGNLTAFK